MSSPGVPTRRAGSSCDPRIELQVERARLVLELRWVRSSAPDAAVGTCADLDASTVLGEVEERLAELDRQHTGRLASIRGDAEREAFLVVQAARADVDSVRRAMSAMRGGRLGVASLR